MRGANWTAEGRTCGPIALKNHRKNSWNRDKKPTTRNSTHTLSPSHAKESKAQSHILSHSQISPPRTKIQSKFHDSKLHTHLLPLLPIHFWCVTLLDQGVVLLAATNHLSAVPLFRILTLLLLSLLLQQNSLPRGEGDDFNPLNSTGVHFNPSHRDNAAPHT